MIIIGSQFFVFREFEKFFSLSFKGTFLYLSVYLCLYSSFLLQRKHQVSFFLYQYYRSTGLLYSNNRFSVISSVCLINVKLLNEKVKIIVDISIGISSRKDDNVRVRLKKIRNFCHFCDRKGIFEKIFMTSNKIIKFARTTLQTR